MKIFASALALLFVVSACTRPADPVTPGSTTGTQSSEGLLGLDADTLAHLDGNARIDFGQVILGASTQLTIGFINGSNRPISELAVSSLTGPFSITDSTGCPKNIDPGVKCVVKVQFNPSAGAEQTFTQTVTVNYTLGTDLKSSFISDVSKEPKVLTATLIGKYETPASLSLAPLAPTYGDVTVGASSVQVFTLTNNGQHEATNLDLTGIAAPFARDNSAETSGCGTTIAGGASCQVAIRYSPTATGTANGSIQSAYHDGLNDQNVSTTFSGNGITPASLAFSQTSVSYGDQATGSHSTTTFSLTNNGQTTATAMVISGISTPVTSTTTCGVTLAPSASCNITVNYDPTIVGALAQTLSLGYHDGAVTTASTFGITATAKTPASLSFSPTSPYDFGTKTTGTTTSKTFTISNGGGIAATSYSFSGIASPLSVSSTTCTTSIAAGGSCTVTIVYAPVSAVTTDITGTASYYDGASAVSATLQITGTAVTPASLSFSASATHDFGDKAKGSSTDFTFTVTNSGGTAASAVSAAVTGAPYSITSDGCSSGVAVSGTCDIKVTFAPTATGSSSDSLVLSYNNGASDTSVTATLAGNGKTPASIGLDNTSVDFGDRATGSSITKTITLTNSGEFTASGISFSSFTTGGPLSISANTCGATLGGSATCTYTVKYAPTTTGATAESITVSYNDGASDKTVSTDYAATAKLPASLTVDVDTTQPSDFGIRAIGSSQTLVVTVTNGGEIPAVFQTPEDFNSTGPLSYSNNTCTTTLDAGDTCTFQIDFKPIVIATTDETVKIVKYNDGAQDQSITLEVKGDARAAAVLALDISTKDFGNVTVGNTPTQVVTISNTGGVVAGSLSIGSFLPTSAMSVSATTCTTSINAGDSCTFTVTYTPSDLVATDDSIVVGYNDGANAQTLGFEAKGNALSPAVITFSSNPLTFGAVTVGASSTSTITLTNGGTSDATGLTPGSFGGTSFAVTGTTCGSTLAAGGTCTADIKFIPSGTGALSDSITLYFNDGFNPTASSILSTSGTGLSRAHLTSSPTALSFGNITVGKNSEKASTITNDGQSAATLSSISISGFNFGFGTFGCFYLAPGGSCDWGVKFTPTTSGAKTATETFGYSDVAGNLSLTVDLSGTGLTVASIAAVSHDFGTVLIGATPTYTYVVTNSGQTDATSLSFGTISAPFTVDSTTCTTTLSAGSSCNVVVKFSPTATGVAGDSLSLSYSNGGGSTPTVNFPMTGTGAKPATLVFSSNPYDFGQQDLNGSPTTTITVTNSGTVTATGLSSSVTGSPTINYRSGSYPGTSGGTCGASLTAGGTCVLSIRYTVGTTRGLQTTAFKLSYGNGVTNTSSTLTVTGTGMKDATLSITPDSSVDFGTNYINTTKDLGFVITNNGDYTAQPLTASLGGVYTFVGGSYPGTEGTCGTSLAGGASCTVKVRYSPTASGATTQNLTASYKNHNTGSTLTNSLQLKGLAVKPGDLDITFNSTGKNTLSISTGTVVLEANVVQPDGKLVVGGYYKKTGNGQSRKILMARYTTAGVLDTSFYVSGGTSTTQGVVIDALTSGDEEIKAMGIQTISGTSYLVVGGYLAMGSNNKFFVARYSLSGAIDTNFGTNGITTISFSTRDDVANAMTMVGNSIVVAGSTQTTSSRVDMAVARLTVDGALDTTFNTTGKQTAVFADDSEGFAVSVGATGQVVVAGYTKISTSKYNAAIAQFTSGGALDTSFNSVGTKSYKLSGTTNNIDVLRGVVVQSDGKIVAGGYSSNGSNYDLVIMKVGTAGALDTTFNTTGIKIDSVSSNSDLAYSMVQQSDGKFVVAGTNSTDVVIVRYKTDGTRDTTFGTNGLVTTDYGATDYALAMTLQPDNGVSKIVVTGYSSNGDGLNGRYWP